MDEDEAGHEGGIGTYEVAVGEDTFVLEVGDSIYYQSPVPHTMRLLGDKPGRTIWVITPPSF